MPTMIFITNEKYTREMISGPIVGVTGTHHGLITINDYMACISQQG